MVFPKPTVIESKKDEESSLRKLVDELHEMKDYLPAKDISFVNSLIKQFKSKGLLSSKQEYWVKRMHESAMAAMAVADGVADADEKNEVVADLTKVFEWFETANKSKLKYPQITFMLDDNKALRLKQSKGGKHPGSIVLTDDKPFGQNEFYGWLLENGEWVKSALGDERSDYISPVIEELAGDPIAYVKEYGVKTGCCCFCNAKLESDNSLALGYGPVCAKRWGLPWNTASAKAVSQ